MFKNVASQKLIVFAFDTTNNTAKTGDAANITAYVSKDYGAVTVLGDTSATEMDSTNAKGYYLFDLTQAETNADTLLFSAKSSTANIAVIGVPATVFTLPTTGILAPTTAGRTLDVSAGGEAGLDWANIGSPTTAVNLSATNIDVDQVVASVTALTTANIADAVWDEDATGHQTQGTFGQAIGDPGSDSDTIWALVNTNLNATVSSRASGTALTTLSTTIGTPAGASIAADIAAIEAQTDDIGAAGAGLTAIPWNSAWDAEVQSEVADALAVYDPPTNAELEARTLVAADYATATNLATVDTVVDAIKVKTDSLTFTVAGQVDANAVSMNDAEILGNGTTGDLWRGE